MWLTCRPLSNQVRMVGSPLTLGLKKQTIFCSERIEWSNIVNEMIVQWNYILDAQTLLPARGVARDVLRLQGEDEGHADDEPVRVHLHHGRIHLRPSRVEVEWREKNGPASRTLLCLLDFHNFLPMIVHTFPFAFSAWGSAIASVAFSLPFGSNVRVLIGEDNPPN